MRVFSCYDLLTLITHVVVSTEPEIQAAAVVFRLGEHDRRALADFARELADSGYRVGGMVQLAYFDDEGRRTHIDSVDLATGDHVMINQPSRLFPDGKECTLDTAALADAGAPLRRALNDRPDLVIAEKFGEQERVGEGLADDILNVIAEGLPILVLVPEADLECWREVTGGEIAELPCEAGALRRWWLDRTTGIAHGTLENGDQFLETTTVLPQVREDVFDFFADVENLQRITPPELAFQILTPTPVAIGEGAIIDFRLRLFGVPFRWRTRIVQWQPADQFIDEQIRGPYGSWRHLHTFVECEAGTRMTDRVEYRLPFRPFGSIALPLVRRQLDRIFRYRASTIRQLLAGDGGLQS